MQGKRSRGSLLLLAIQPPESPTYSLSFRWPQYPLLMPHRFLLPVTLLSLLFRWLSPSPPMDCLLSLDALNRPPRHPPAPTHASAAAVLRTLSHLLHKAASGALSPVHTVQQQPNGILGPALLSLAALTLSPL